MVASTAGVVASESALASQVGARVLESGGNAVDAAIATNAMMGLVAPMNDGIGGDLFAIVQEADSGQLYGLNASGWSPAELSIDYLRARDCSEMPLRGIDSVTVPGAVAGWNSLHTRFGRLPLVDVLAPAIAYAERGFCVEEVVQQYWRDSEALLRQDSASAHTYLPAGRAPGIGAVFRNPELAWSYRQIASEGCSAFYRGEIARRILATSQQHGGSLLAGDLIEYEPEWVQPISTTYRGWTVYELPPNGQGIAALEMLNIMEHFALADWGHNSPRTLHTLIEAKKLAYADMIRHVGDPRFGSIPTERLRAKSFAASRAAQIDPASASERVLPAVLPGTDQGTTYLAVADRQGNMVSLIQSNFATIGFGSGVTVGGAGFVLQNRGALFSLDPSHPNALAGRKRTVHTIIPGFMQRAGRRIAFGVMGGWNQAQAHAQFVSNVADFSMNIQAALDAPRFCKETFEGRDVNLEARIAPATRQALAGLGHDILLRGDYCSVRMGAGQAVERDGVLGVNFGASDPRKDGAAATELIALR